MAGAIMHVGVTVSDLDRSIAFYRDVVGLTYVGQLTMEGGTTERLFGRKGSIARVGYLNGGQDVHCPPLELIQFTSHEAEKQDADLFRTSISEICFASDDLWKEYDRMKALGVEFLSEPQEFDFTKDGFGKSLAIYFKDPDGIIMEMMQAL